ncbi:Transcription initiation factor TFIID subunit 5 [Rhizina undulata]
MASQGPPPSTNGGGGSTAAAGSPQALNQIVIEYLSKKGYSRTEAMLRVESAHTDNEGRPILSKLEDHPDTMYEKAYSHLKRWIDNSLDLYKPELRRLLYPIFVHSYLQLIATGFQTPGKNFFKEHHQEHEATYGHDLKALAAISLPQHVEENPMAKLYRENKYRVTLSRTTLNLLTHFLVDTEDSGGELVHKLLNQRVEIRTVPGMPTFSSTRSDDSMLAEDEGIPGHTSGRLVTGGDLPGVKLGQLPMDRELISDVEDSLRKEDIREKEATGADMLGVSASGSLLDEFQKIKREESEDSPMRDALPLPPYTGVDVESTVKLVKESRDKVSLSGPSGPALPSVCMYTWHNTQDGLNCLDFSEDGALAAAGFSESYVRIYSLKGKPLPVFGQEQSPAPKSRRLIGHSGPVFGISFSPDNRYLLSCSEDRTVRLWSMETYTALVPYKGHDGPVWDVQFGPFGHYFATVGHDHTARLWSCDHIYPLRIFAGHVNDVDCVTFHPNSAYVFTGSSDKTVRMWDVQSGNSVRLFTGHTAAINTLAVSPDGKLLASAGEDSMINLWDLASGKLMKSMRGHGKTSIYSLSFSMEGNVLVSGGADMTVRCWDVAHGTGAATAEPPESFGAVGLAGASDATTKVDGAPVSGAGKGKKGGKDVVATPDHLTVFYTKKSPVYKVQFTRKNMVVAGSAYIA